MLTCIPDNSVWYLGMSCWWFVPSNCHHLVLEKPELCHLLNTNRVSAKQWNAQCETHSPNIWYHLKNFFFLLFFSQLLPLLLCSSAISSCYSRVYQSLANLIRWSDQVMLEGINSEDKEMVTTVKDVIKAVLDGVKVHETNIVNFIIKSIKWCVLEEICVNHIFKFR